MRTSARFADRKEAGKALAKAIAGRRLVDPVVLALPRGGVPVAVEVARALGAPLDLVLVRKIGLPDQRELAAAAVVDGGAPEIVVNEDVLASAGLTRAYVDREATGELREIERRRQVYLGSRPRLALDERVLVLVDDGIATGASIKAAILALKRRRPAKLVLAVPVAPSSTIDSLRSGVDEIVCLAMPEPFHAVGMQYDDFHQVSDDEVVALIRQADAEARPMVRDDEQRDSD